MPSQKNIHQFAEITKALQGSQAVILTEYAGLTVAEQTILRAEAEKNDSQFLVTKNNILRRALKETSPELAAALDKEFNGPTAVLFAKKDAVMGAKVVAKFNEDHDKLKIKGGFMLDKILSIKDIMTLSKLPSRNELLSKLLAQLSAPAQALVRQLNAPAQNLVYALEAIKNKGK